MKRLLSFLLLPAVVICLTVVSCEPTPQDPEPGNEENTDPGTVDPGTNPGEDEQTVKPGTYKFVASTLKGKWEAGDKIYVHGSLGSWAEVVTLSAADISADGKTATGDLSTVTDLPAKPDGLYAGWPDEAVKHSIKKIGAKTSFESCDGLLTVAYLKDDTFTFIDVSSALTFNVSGDFDNYALAAGDRSGVVVSSFDIEYTSEKTSYSTTSTGYPFKYGTVQSGKKVTVWMPGDMTLKGVCIYLAKGDNWTKVYTLADDVKLKPAETKDLGDITSKLTDYDGLAPRMPMIVGEPTRYTVSFNELSGLCLSADEDFLWSVGDDGELAKIDFEGKVIESHYISGDTEAISRNRVTGDLLIGLEPDGVGIIKAPDFSGNVKTLYSISACKNYGNSGIEGLTYYKDGTVLTGAQANSHLICTNLSTGEVLWERKMYDKNLVSEIADLCYDPLTDWLWIIDSEAKKVFVFNSDASQLLGAYPITGSNPESVCVDHKHSCIWVGDDYGSTSYIYKYQVTGLDDAIIE